MKHGSFRLLALWLWLSPALVSAQTQGFAIDRFDPSERGSDWFVGDSLDLRGHARPAVGLVLDYANKPLVVVAGSDERAAIIEHQWFAHLGASVVLLDRLRLGLNLPVALVTDGDRVRVGTTVYAAESGASLGDIRLGADLRLYGRYGDPVTMAIGAQVYAPTGSREAFTGDGKFRVAPRLQVAGQVGVFEYSGRLALNYRAQRDWLDGVPVGTEIGFAATAGISARQRALLFGVELWGSTVVINRGAFDKATTPLEFTAGVHWRPRDFRAGLGVGPGLTRGYGSPVVRILAMFEWAPSPGADRDGDGILDGDDACPTVPGAANVDPRLNGCPLSRADTDLDGIIDAFDACPTVPGTANDDPAKNGCPLMLMDRDEDGDGILPPLDACPAWPGPAHDDPTTNGCPLARIEKDQIVITERIEFEFDSATLLTASSGVLTAVLNVLREHPELNVVLIEGHTDSIGDATYNKVLSEQRAAAVRSWLITHGVDSARLLDAGFGLKRPIDTNDTAEGRQRNRRVEFHIIERDGKRLDTLRTVDEP
ncbi:MAG: hypothetical protein RL701_7706 [Pseudomonadota bacterium]|jgi:outer membrane protein OmpA-like peptidoglycan-associated protein